MRKYKAIIAIVVCMLVCLIAFSACSIFGSQPSPSKVGASVTSISVKTEAKTDYNIGEAIDLSSLKIQAEYSDGSTADLSINDIDIDVSSFDSDVAGTYVVIVKYKADNTKTCTFSVTVFSAEGKPTPRSIVIKREAKLTYYVGEPLDYSMFTADIVYTDDSSKEFTANDFNFDTSQYNKDEPGTYKIMVTYKADPTISFGFNVMVITKDEAVVTSIIIKSTPKLDYIQGEALILSALKISAVYSNHTEKELSSDEFAVDGTAYKKDVVGTYRIIVKYKADESKTCYFDVTVSAKGEEPAVFTGISIKSAPKIVIYNIGSPLSLDGLVVIASYSDGSTQQLSADQYSIDANSYDKNKVGDYMITVKYKADETKTAQYKVSVKGVVGISIKEGTYSTIYASGYDFPSFDNSKIQMQISYSDNSVITISGEELDDMFRLDCDFKDAGKQTITVKYRDDESITCSYEVTVVDIGTLVPVSISASNYGKVIYTVGDTELNSYYDAKVTYAEFGNRQFAANNFEVDSHLVNFGVAGEYAVRVYAKNPDYERMDNVFFEYIVTVLDVDGYTLSALEVDKSSTHITEFFYCEDFNSNGIVVNKILSKVGEENIKLPADGYTVTCDAYNNKAIGEYTVTVSLGNVSTSYKIEVVSLPCVGTFVSILQEEGVFFQRYNTIITPNNEVYPYKNGAFATEPMVIKRVERHTTDEGEPYILIGCDTDTYRYELVSKRLNYNAYALDIEYVINVVSSDPVYIEVINGNALLFTRNGKVSQEQIDGLSSFGELFLDADGKTKLTDSTIIDKNCTAYLIFTQTDYTGKPFLGTFASFDKDGKVGKVFGTILAKCILVDGQEISYSATQIGEDWSISVASISISYDSAKESLTVKDTTVFLRLDTDKYATVTVLDKSLNHDYSRYKGLFAVEKGKPYVAEVEKDYAITFTVGETDVEYDGGNITQDITLVVKSVVSTKPYVTSINIVSKPTKLEYTEGENLDFSGLVVEAHYSDGTIVTLHEIQYGIDHKNYDSLTAGDYTINVYMGENGDLYDSFKVSVITIKSLQIKAGCIPSVYALNLDYVNIEQITVEIVYSDDTTENISGEALKTMFDVDLRAVEYEGYDNIYIRLKNNYDKAIEFPITVYDLHTLTPNSLIINKVYQNSSVLYGEVYSTLEVSLTYEEFGLREFVIDEYYYNIDYGAVDNTQEGEYTVTVTALDQYGNPYDGITAQYSYRIADIEEYSFTGLKINTENNLTVFYLGEAIDTYGLRVDKIFKKEGQEDFTIQANSSEYWIDESAFDSSKAGIYEIKVISLDNQEIYETISVEVKGISFFGDYVYMQDGIILPYCRIKADNKLYLYQDGVLSTEGKPITNSSRFEDNGTYLSITFGEDNSEESEAESLSFNAITGEVYENYLISKAPIQYMLTVDHKSQMLDEIGNDYDSFVILYTIDGTVPQNQLDVLAPYGVLYTDEECTVEITAETVFDTHRTVYLRYNQLDYSDAPFLGAYCDTSNNYTPDRVCYILEPKKLIAKGIENNYTAYLEDSVWHITFGDHKATFYEGNDYISVDKNDYMLLDTQNYVMVTVKDNSKNGDYYHYADTYALHKGNVFDKFEQENEFVIFVLEDGVTEYHGEPISENTVLCITNIISLSSMFNYQYGYGTFIRNLWISDNVSICDYNNSYIYSYGYIEVIGYDAGKLYFSITFEENDGTIILNGYYFEENGVKVVVIDDTEVDGNVEYTEGFENEYILNDPDYYKGLSFVGSYFGNIEEFYNEESDQMVSASLSATINSDGSSSVIITATEGGDILLDEAFSIYDCNINQENGHVSTSFSGNNYSMNFNISDSGTYVSINDSPYFVERTE